MSQAREDRASVCEFAHVCVQVAETAEWMCITVKKRVRVGVYLCVRYLCVTVHSDCKEQEQRATGSPLVSY